MSGTAIQEVPSSIQSLTKLIQLELYNCTKLKHIPTGICKLKSLSLQDCSELEAFPEILETMEFLESLLLIGTAIKELPPSIEHLDGLQHLNMFNCKNLEMLPSSICNLTSLQSLGLSSCSRLDKLPDNLGNLKSLKFLAVGGSAISQLPSSITCLENLERLYLKNCNLMEIPEYIGCLSSLKELVLGGNKFESLPKSIKHLSKLEYLSIRECNMLRSLTELPVALKRLEAINCKQLCQALPDASEFKLCIHSKCHKDLKNHQLDQFDIYLLGSEIPEWFTYQRPGSCVNIPVLRQTLSSMSNGLLVSQALCIETISDDVCNA
ncbi:hypothetical protein EZV62_008120 [Acer yangbiense]|uniref:Disease resistance R13L4/SHOC-2-like LRR domain-containing protein n=1 Tax=Acer yangbiense TaxID=1000413 RepID=A0A5C7ICU5_9ROSI|nr:hypothetical protein EZV62_008120 [Acer yangbiense]